VKIDKPGLYALTEQEYHADRLTPEPSLSSSLARTLLDRSPRHAWHQSARLNPDHEPRHSETFDIGKAFHRLLLRRGADIVIVDADDWRGKDARVARQEAHAAGATPMLAAQYDAAMDMVSEAEARLRLVGIDIGKGYTEEAAFAVIDNVWCRALIDYVPPAGPLMDIKTCEDASPDACLRAVTAYGYSIQARHYMEVWKAATGEDRGFRFLFVEKAPPHEVSIIELHDDPNSDADWMLSAADQCREARLTWRRCLDTGHWPGFPVQVAVLGAPTWYTQRWEDRPKPSRAALDAARLAQAPA
jgi:NAD(P)-dependent dehydrogenase (short-subunit alcohol dehydrogenase family)